MKRNLNCLVKSQVVIEVSSSSILELVLSLKSSSILELKCNVELN
jgi:hypothetical protein